MRTLEMTEPGTADVLRLTDRPVPAPGPGQVLIRVTFAGLNFADALARRGAPGYALNWPFVPGLEVAGTVEGPVGDGVGHLVPGDQVVALTPGGGGFAEYVVADARLASPVPAGVDLATASTVPVTWATALGLVRRALPVTGESVLITSAAGGVGSALATVLTRHGITRVIGGISSAAKSSALRGGVVPVVRGEDFFARAVEAAGGPIDVVLDSVGGPVLGEAASHLATGGRLISYGAAAGHPDPDSPGPAALRKNNLTVSGFSILGLARSAPQRVEALVTGSLTLLGDGLEIPTPTLVGWDGLVEAHLRQSEGLTTGKVVLAAVTGEG